jgi:hypothetical protein
MLCLVVRSITRVLRSRSRCLSVLRTKINRVPIRQQLAKFLVPHGHIVDCFEDSVMDKARAEREPGPSLLF